MNIFPVRFCRTNIGENDYSIHAPVMGQEEQRWHKRPKKEFKIYIFMKMDRDVNHPTCSDLEFA